MKKEEHELTPYDENLACFASEENDESLPHSLRRSVWLVQDEEDNETYTADEILDGQPQGIIFDIRHSLYASYKSGEYKYVCKQCQQPLGLKVRTHEGDFFPFFSHFQNSGDCPLKNQIEIDPTHTAREREAVFKASALYQQMIERLKEMLKRTQGFNSVEENKVISKPEIKGYRKPAIYSHYNNTEVCFDLLVSNPLVSLLVGRNAFYKLHKMFYLWLFPSFTTKQQRLCQKDILYMNRRNVFVFDSKDFYKLSNRDFCGHNTNPSSHLYAYEESIRQNKLMLNCYWQTPEVSEINGETHISIKWNGPKLVAFDDLKFDWENFELYYHDSDVDFYNSYPIKTQRQIDEWLRIKKDRWVKIFDSIEKRKILYAQLLAKRERRERLKYYHSLIQDGDIDISVRYDEESNLYGFSVDDFDIIPPIYYDAKPFFCGYAWVRKKERWGVIDIYNNRVANFQYSQLSELGNGLFYVFKNKKNILVDYRGEQMGHCTFDSIEKLKEGLYKIGNTIVTGYDRGYTPGWGFYNYKYTNILWGIINERGEEILPCCFNSIGEFVDGRSKVTRDSHTGYVDENGHEEYELIKKEDVIVYKSPLLEKLGLMDKNGNILIPPTYDFIGDFIDGLAIVNIGKSSRFCGYGIIDMSGKLITEGVAYSSVKIFYHGLFAIYKDGRFIIKKINDVTFAKEFNEIGKYDEEFICVSKDGEWGLINYEGEEVIPIKYGEIVDFSKKNIHVKIHKLGNKIAEIDWEGNEIYPIRRVENAWIYESMLNMRCGLMDETHNPITNLEYFKIEHLYGDYFKALKDDNWGIIGSKGNVILSFEYDAIYHISEGYSKIAKGKSWNNKWGVVDPEGDIIIPIDFYEILGINNQIVQVRKEKYGKIAQFNFKGEEIYTYKKCGDIIIYESSILGKSGLMDSEYRPITDLIFDEVTGTRTNDYIVKKKSKYGIITYSGNVIVPLKYDRIIEKGGGFFCVRERANGFWGLINYSNTVVIPLKYDAIGDIEMNVVNVKKGRSWKKITIHNTDKPSPDIKSIDLSKLEDGIIYDAISTGIMRTGVFIKIPNIGVGLIPAKEIFRKNRKLNEFKRGVSLKVQLLRKDIEKNRATFQLVE